MLFRSPPRLEADQGLSRDARATELLNRRGERVFMQIPLQISCENVELSEAIRTTIEREVERLEQHQHHITGCRVGVIAPSEKHRHGSVYRINIWVTIPPTRTSWSAISHPMIGVCVEVAIKEAFAAVRRQIEALARR